jgi:hypothetical protein
MQPLRIVDILHERLHIHCQRVHQHLIAAGGVTPGQVQADELHVRVVGGAVWMAMAVSVARGLWLGGVISACRDRRLIDGLVDRVCACGAVGQLLLASDGLVSYPRQALRRFRHAIRTGRRGRPRLRVPDGLLIVQAVKRYARRRVREVERQIIRGSETAVAAVLTATQGTAMAVINTAYIERLNAGFRARLATLVRRRRAMARQVATLETGMWIVGTVYQPRQRTPQLGWPDTRAGGRDNRPPLDDARTAHLSRAVARRQTTRTTTALVSGDQPRCLIAVSWGTTMRMCRWREKARMGRLSGLVIDLHKFVADLVKCLLNILVEGRDRLSTGEAFIEQSCRYSYFEHQVSNMA